MGAQHMLDLLEFVLELLADTVLDYLLSGVIRWLKGAEWGAWKIE
jgi:hypothetical protein